MCMMHVFHVNVLSNIFSILHLIFLCKREGEFKGLLYLLFTENQITISFAENQLKNQL